MPCVFQFPYENEKRSVPPSAPQEPGQAPNQVQTANLKRGEGRTQTRGHSEVRTSKLEEWQDEDTKKPKKKCVIL